MILELLKVFRLLAEIGLVVFGRLPEALERTPGGFGQPSEALERASGTLVVRAPEALEQASEAFGQPPEAL